MLQQWVHYPLLIAEPWHTMQALGKGRTQNGHVAHKLPESEDTERASDSQPEKRGGVQLLPIIHDSTGSSENILFVSYPRHILRI